MRKAGIFPALIWNKLTSLSVPPASGLEERIRMSPSAPVTLTGLALTGAILAQSGALGSAGAASWHSFADTFGLAAKTWTQMWTRSLTHSGAGPVGQTLSDTIMLRPISGHETYRYAVIDGHRLVVDASTRKVIYVID
jgi:hypothetical protein